LSEGLSLFNDLLESAGGLKGVLFALSGILLKTFSGEAARGLQNMVYNIKSFFGLTKAETISMKEKASSLVDEMVVGPSGESDRTGWNAEKDGVKQKI
jgi:hypothetical protein